MKSVLSFLLIFSFTFSFSQLDRSKPPQPGPAPEIQIGEYELFQLKNGLKVIVVENHKIPKISYTLIVDRDPIMEAEYTGYLSFTGELLGTATTSRTKAQIDEEIDFIGGSLGFSSSSCYASSLKKHNEVLLDLMSDVILNPVFHQKELDKIRMQTISSLEANKDDPASISSVVSNLVIYGEDHPYGEILTDSTVNKITIEKCQNYYNDYWRPNITYIVIVGDITPKEAKKSMNKYFGAWESKEVPSHEYKQPEGPETKKVVLVDRENSVQSVIKVAYPVQFELGSEDYIAAKMMNTLLGGGTYRLFDNLRETHGYTYGAYSKLNADELAGVFMAYTNVRNEVTDSAVYEIYYEMNRMINELATDEELQRVKNNITGSFALAIEKPQTIARFALNIERYKLPKDYYKNYLKDLEEVTLEDIKAMAAKYLKPQNSYVIIVGKAADVEEGLKKIASGDDFLRYDKEGNRID